MSNRDFLTDERTGLSSIEKIGLVVGMLTLAYALYFAYRIYNP